jgi:hypothetical protein
MPENKVFIDYANLPTPSEGFLATLFITVRKVARSRAFYTEVLGGQLVLEENPCMVKLANSWIIMNPGGPPTPDKPDITVANTSQHAIFLNRVAAIDACYREWVPEARLPRRSTAAQRSAVTWDERLLEVGQSTGYLPDNSPPRPEDLPADGIVIAGLQRIAGQRRPVRRRRTSSSRRGT